MKVDYQEFLKAKQKMIVDSGKEVDDTEINPHLFDYQHDIVKWALKKGKSAVFAGTGLGKTRIQLAWADLVGGASVDIRTACSSLPNSARGKRNRH